MSMWDDLPGDSDPVIKASQDLVTEASAALDLEPGMVAKAVVVTHVMRADGSTDLHIFRSTEVQDWEVRGMLSEVLSDLSAFAVIDFMDEEED